MDRIKCYCGLIYVSKIDCGEQRFTKIDACPSCKKTWTKASVSGVYWKSYPELKEVILTYKHK